MSNTIDLRAVKYADTINDNLVCCICQAPFIDPITTQCGHTFCLVCIQQALEASHLCPIDRALIYACDLKPAVRIISNMVNELLVHCPEEGCDFIGQRMYIETHVKQTCQYTMAFCELEECKEKFLKKDSSSHAENCQFRSAECHMCKKKMKMAELQAHFEECIYKSIECEYCGTLRPRVEHVIHVDECPQYQIRCTNCEFNCPWKDQRQYLPEHLKECPYEPIKEYLQRQQIKESLLEEELHKLQDENRLLKRQQLEAQSNTDRILEKLSVLFPLYFSPHSDILLEEPVISETERLNSELELLSSKLTAIELRQNMSLMTETIRMQEELAGLWTAYNSLRMQMHHLVLGRQLSSSTARQNDGESTSSVSQNSQTRIRAILNSSDTQSTSRAETKL